MSPETHTHTYHMHLCVPENSLTSPDLNKSASTFHIFYAMLQITCKIKMHLKAELKYAAVKFWHQCILLTSRQELHDEVEVEGVLKRVVHLDHPLMVGLHQYVPLRPHMGHLSHTRAKVTLYHCCLTSCYEPLLGLSWNLVCHEIWQHFWLLVHVCTAAICV